MPRQARKKSKTGIYHIMLRAVNQQQIFEDSEDYNTENRPLCLYIWATYCAGEMKDKGSSQNVEIRYDYDDGMTIMTERHLYGDNSRRELVVSGTYKCTDDTLTLHVEKQANRYLDEPYEVIIFVKTRYGKGYVEPRLLCCR